MPVPDNPVVGLEDEELDIDYSELEAKYRLDPTTGFDDTIVIDNIPIVDIARKQKLVDRLRAAFDKVGAGIEESGCFMPWDEAGEGEGGSNKGFIFLTYPSPAAASHALRALDQTLFGKNRLRANRFGDIETFGGPDVNVKEEWVDEFEGNEVASYEEQEHLRSWLADPAGRDQYATFRHEQVDVMWNGRGGVPEAAVASQPRWGELFVSWSPLGTYFATAHRIGVALWSGKSFNNVKTQRFTHPGVRLIDFSPNEKYLVTFSPEPIECKNPTDANGLPDPRAFQPDDEGNSIAVWEVKTGHLLRTFPGEPPAPQQPALTEEQQRSGFSHPAPRRLAWPLLRWSPDDAYVARCTMHSHISVYEAPSMVMLDKKSIKIEGVLDFEWCPDKERGVGKDKENLFAYWTPEVDNQPARVGLMAVPSRKVLRQKNLFNVSDCKLFWQDQGHYLCVKVDRFTKTKKNIYSNLEIFRVREKDFPVEVIELKDVCSRFGWEPQGNRFCMITSSDPNMGNVAPGVVIKNNVDFYHLDPKKGDFRLMRRLDNKTVTHFAWSPKGRHIALATVGSAAKSDIEFWDLDFSIDDTRKDQGEPGSNMQLLAVGDHYGITGMSWDPSGRYLATVASAWEQSREPGYIIWDFRGQELQKVPLDKFKQFVWRPRPATLLTKDDLKRIRKNLREYSRQFDEEDAAEESNVSAELLAYRRRLIDEWNAWRKRRVTELEAERKKEGKVVEQKSEKDEEKEQVEEWVEEVIDETEVVVVG